VGVVEVVGGVMGAGTRDWPKAGTARRTATVRAVKGSGRSVDVFMGSPAKVYGASVAVWAKE
jgi:hypothetical protein